MAKIIFPLDASDAVLVPRATLLDHRGKSTFPITFAIEKCKTGQIKVLSWDNSDIIGTF